MVIRKGKIGCDHFDYREECASIESSGKRNNEAFGYLRATNTTESKQHIGPAKRKAQGFTTTARNVLSH